jgi:hypothetical protein
MIDDVDDLLINKREKKKKKKGKSEGRSLYAAHLYTQQKYNDVGGRQNNERSNSVCII